MRIVLLASTILQAIAIGMSFAENIGKEKQRIIRCTGWFLLLIQWVYQQDRSVVPRCNK